MNIELPLLLTLSWFFITSGNLKASVEIVLAKKLTPEEETAYHLKRELEDEKKEKVRIAAQISAALNRDQIPLTPDEQAAIKEIMASLNGSKDQVIHLHISKPNICWRTKMGNHGNYFPYQNVKFPNNKCSCEIINTMIHSTFNIHNVMDHLIQTGSVCTDPEEIEVLKQERKILPWSHPISISWYDTYIPCKKCQPKYI